MIPIFNGHYLEEALDVSLPIIDAHHHLWPPSGAQVSSPAGPSQQAVPGESVKDAYPYSLDDLETDTRSGHNVVGTVYVECSAHYRKDGPDWLRSVGETEWVASQAAPDGLCAAIVSYADLTLGSKVDQALDAHLEASRGKLKGIRQNGAWDPNPGVYSTPRRPPQGLLLQPEFGAGVARLATLGLAFETWVYFHQLTDIAQLAQAHPDLTIVLNHLGGPAATGPYASRRQEVLGEWRTRLEIVARQENVVIKLGGIGMPAFSEGSLFEDAPASSTTIANHWGPDLRFIIDAFGPNRCMFESNYPVDSQLTDYVTLWNAFKRSTRGYSDEDRRALFAGTARRVYRL